LYSRETDRISDKADRGLRPQQYRTGLVDGAGMRLRIQSQNHRLIRKTLPSQGFLKHSRSRRLLPQLSHAAKTRRQAPWTARGAAHGRVPAARSTLVVEVVDWLGAILAQAAVAGLDVTAKQPGGVASSARKHRLSLDLCWPSPLACFFTLETVCSGIKEQQRRRFGFRRLRPASGLRNWPPLARLAFDFRFVRWPQRENQRLDVALSTCTESSARFVCRPIWWRDRCLTGKHSTQRAVAILRPP